MHWLLIANLLLLTWIGSKPVEDPFILIGHVSSLFYFSYFLVFIPSMGWLENSYSIYNARVLYE